MADKLAVWKQALVHLGQGSINALTDEVEARYAFENAWPGVVEEAFNAGDWNFAKVSVELVESTTGTPAIGWSKVWDYPDDYIRIVAVSAYPGFYEPFGEYVDEGGFIHSRTAPLYLRYISSETLDDVEAWPTMFWRYVAASLAFETCYRITGGTTKEESLERKKDIALRKAKSVDARQEQGKRIAAGSWIRSRKMGMGRGDSLGPTLVGGEIVLGEGDV